jgi:hypothetical protein
MASDSILGNDAGRKWLSNVHAFAELLNTVHFIQKS